MKCSQKWQLVKKSFFQCDTQAEASICIISHQLPYIKIHYPSIQQSAAIY